MDNSPKIKEYIEQYDQLVIETQAVQSRMSKLFEEREAILNKVAEELARLDEIKIGDVVVLKIPERFTRPARSQPFLVDSFTASYHFEHLSYALVGRLVLANGKPGLVQKVVWMYQDIRKQVAGIYSSLEAYRETLKK